MNNTQDDTSLDLEKLADDYRAIKAPPDLAGRVQARIDGRYASRGWWLPALGAVATIAGVAVIVATLSPPRESSPVVAHMPTLSTVAKIKLQKPAALSLSLANIRNVSTPAMPAKPNVTRPTRPANEINHDAQLNRKQERQNAYT
ncbi:MAG: hypothetical protein ACR2PS_13420 [Pseudomonadales bacterium]